MNFIKNCCCCFWISYYTISCPAASIVVLKEFCGIDLTEKLNKKGEKLDRQILIWKEKYKEFYKRWHKQKSNPNLEENLL